MEEVKITNQEFRDTLCRRKYWYIKNVEPNDDGSICIWVVCGWGWKDLGEDTPYPSDVWKFYHVYPPSWFERLRKITHQDKFDKKIQEVKQMVYDHNKEEYDRIMMCKPK